MPTDVIMPQMGESIFEGTITKWFKKAGDLVQKDEPLFEISTDKVDAEIPSPVAGVLSEIKVGEGATVEINTVVAVVTVVLPEAASAFLVLSVASIKETTGGVTTANRPHCSKKERRSAFSRSLSSSSIMYASPNRAPQ